MDKNSIISTKQEAKKLVNYAWSLVDAKPKNLADKDIDLFTTTDWNDTLIPLIVDRFDQLENEGYKLIRCTADSIRNLLKDDVGKKNQTILVICLFILFEKQQINAEDKIRLTKNMVTTTSNQNKLYFLQKTVHFIEEEKKVNSRMNNKPHLFLNSIIIFLS